MSAKEASSVLRVHGVKVLGGGILGEAASDGEFKVADEGVEDLRGQGLVDDSVIPLFSEVNEGFWGHVVESDQGFVGFRMLGRVIVKECPEIFDLGEGVGRVVWAIARVSGGGNGIRGTYAVDGGSEDGEGCGEHGFWDAGGCQGESGTMRVGIKVVGSGCWG